MATTNQKRKMAQKGKSKSVAPVATATRRVTRRPVMKNTINGVRIAHREYVRDVPGSVAFSIITNAINPGLPTLFPWLSQIAARFELYKFVRLVFHYETQAPTSATGTFMEAIDYDASDSSPDSKTELRALTGSVRSAPWQDIQMNLKIDGKQRFVRFGAAPSGTDIKLYDVGNLFLATQGQGGTTAIGELSVEYVIQLEKTTLEVSCPGGTINATTGVSKSDCFGSAPSLSGPLPVAVSATANSLVFKQPFEGLYTARFDGTGTLDTITLLSTSTATVSMQEGIKNAASTQSIFIAKVKAEFGDLLTWTLSGFTTVTGVYHDLASTEYNTA